MAQNVTIAGNQYPNVPSVLIPKTGGGGNAIFADPSVVTAVAADVASGKYFLDSSGVLTQGTASGGGGASNVVTGTFKGTTTGEAMDVTLNYSGSGYPIAAAIYPSGGVAGNSAYFTLVQRYATAMFCVTKASVDLTPAYAKTANVDDYVVLHRYKNSTSNANSYGQGGGQGYITTGTNPTASQTNVMNFKSKTTMSVFIASTSYGFAANIEYTYWVIYSS